MRVLSGKVIAGKREKGKCENENYTTVICQQLMSLICFFFLRNLHTGLSSWVLKVKHTRGRSNDIYR